MKMNVALIIVAVIVILALPTLEKVGISKDVSGAVFAVSGFTALIIRKCMKFKSGFDTGDLVLSSPIAVLCALVFLKEIRIISLPSVVIWVTAVVLFVLALGYTARADP